ncbi:MAG TPA: hypothetical protein VN478_01010 [Clostridia bacterium]|nr:hypothetical protein [Clostridia bacterium]
MSVTGEECALHCNHCDAHYLQHMVPVTAARRVLESGEYSSILLSGGSDRSGRLPLMEHLAFIAWVHEQGIRINAHVGLQSDEDVKALSPYFDRVSLDYVWDEGTIHDVYHLQRSGVDYLHTTQAWVDAFAAAGGPDALISASQRVNLHLTIGLKGGAIVGEYSAIDSLVEFQPASLVFLVLIPTEGTVYGTVPVVPIADVESVFAYARLKLPSTDLVLGCMHPKAVGYGEQLAHLAAQYRFRGVVGERAEDECVEQVEECCVFYR